MSMHNARVIEIKEILPHPNADSLGLIQIEGFTVCIKLTDFKAGDLAVYIEPDSVVPTTLPEFSFLKDHNKTTARTKVKKLRGIYSQGLLVPAPVGVKIGDDLMSIWGITHYEPSLPMTLSGDNEAPPPGFYPVYDVENFNKYSHIIKSGTEVAVTEKMHGSNSRYCWRNNRLYCGSRTNWKKYDPISIWWKAAEQNEWITEWCRQYPDFTLYGEVFGQVQNLKYGARPNEFFFRAFDVWDGNKWLNYRDARQTNAWWVPQLYIGPFDEEMARGMAEQNSDWPGAKHYREGVVIRTVVEQTHPDLGRVQLKIVGNRYLEKS